MRPRDRDRFAAYMDSRWPWLFRLACGLTWDSDLAADLARATLTDACAAWPQVRRAEDPDAHVRRILVRRSTRLPRARPAPGCASPGPDAPGPVSSPEAGRTAPGPATGGTTPAQATDISQAPDTSQAPDEPVPLLPALAGLPPRQRAVVVLRYWEDLPDGQVAAALRCRPATVRAEAGRALETLRRAGALRGARDGTGP